MAPVTLRHVEISWTQIRRGMVVLFGVSFVALFTAGVLRAQLGPLLSERAPWQGALVGAAFVAVGIFVMSESGQRVNGALLAVFGVGYWLSQLGPLVSSTGVALLLTLAQYLPWVCLVVVLLRYPERRLERGYGRAFIVIVVAWLAIWQTVAIFTWPPRGVSGYNSAQWPLWLPDYEVNSVALWALDWGSAAFGAGFLVLMAVRVVRTRGMDRRTYLPVYLAASAAVAVVLSNLVANMGAFYARLLWLERVGLLVIAAALLFGALSRRLARLRVADLVLRVNAAAEPAQVQEALRRTMADRSLSVLFWSAERADYIDVEGQPPPSVESGRRLALKVTNRSGGPLAIVLVDPSAVHHRELLASALAASALALENAALHASVLARLAEVRESRARIVAAGDAERRRLERDLHDGAQQHLVAIAVKLRLVRDSVEDDPADALAVLDELRTDVQEAIQALRALAHGIFPPLLASGGLCEALPAVAARAALPTEVRTVGVGRYPPQVENAVYFSCLEALQNAGKHAGLGATATVRVWEDLGSLRFEVTDDGVGSDAALAGSASGQGFTNMSDRLGAVGGLLDVHACPGGGVRVSGVIPL